MFETIAHNFWTFIVVIVLGGLFVVGLAVDVYFRYGPKKPNKDDSYKYFKQRMKDKYDDPTRTMYD